MPSPRELPHLNDDTCWTACLTRDRSADGTFVFAVITTGVYCRPSCPGRPKRENVRFFAETVEARQAGFRACKRCQPDAAVREHQSRRMA